MAFLIAAAMVVPSFLVDAPVEAASGWEDADTGVHGLSRALALDRGRPRIAYHTRSGVVGYAWCDSGCDQASAWGSVELVRTEFFSTPIDLAVDGWGRPHLAYYDIEREGVFYATCEAGCDRASAWTHTRVDDSTNEDGLSLAVDPWGRPRIAYLRYGDVATRGLVYAACDRQCTDSARWSTARVGASHGRPNLALDGTKPRIAASASKPGTTDRELRYWACESACLDGASWQHAVVTSFESIGEPSLVVEGPRAHIAFNPIGKAVTSLRYVRCESGCTSPESWSDPVMLTTPPQRALAPDLVVVNGRPRIAYTLCPGACTIYTASDESHVYYTSCEERCTLAPSWETVHIAGNPATWGRLALDGERPRVAYADTTNQSDILRHATCDAPCGAAGTWPPPPSSPPPSDDPASPTPGAPGSGADPGTGAGSGESSSPPGAVTADPSVSAGAAGSYATGANPASPTDGSGSRGSAAGRGHSGAGGTTMSSGPGSGDGVIEDLARAPATAIDVITNPSQMLSWPWGRISLKSLALLLLALASRPTYLEGVGRYERWRSQRRVPSA